MNSWQEELLNVVAPIFFFYVGQEIRLASQERRSSLISPALAALGGMVLPAGLYLASAAAFHLPWKIFGTTMATDLPLALIAVSLFPKAFSNRIRHYLLVLAVADDVGSLIVLALLFNKKFELKWLAAQLAVLGVLYLFRKNHLALLLVPLGWWISLHSGFQPTVIAALMGVIVVTPSKDFLLALERTSYFLCIPLFLVAVLSDGISLAAPHGVTVAITVARVIGKPLGIYLGYRVARDHVLSKVEARAVATLGLFGLSVSLLFLHVTEVSAGVSGEVVTALIYINIIAVLATASWRYFLTRATAA